MPSYNGHPSRAAWEVHIWITGYEPWQALARHHIRTTRTLDEAARRIVADLPDRTPDGARISYSTTRRAIRGGI